MAHTITIKDLSTLIRVATLSITSYTNGTGEQFTLAEIGASTKVTQVIPLINPSTRNSLGVMLFPLFANGVLKLFQFSGGTFVEIATNANLNASFDAVLFILND